MCGGLKSDDDCQIYIRNDILKELMTFSSTPLADDETKGLILQVILSFLDLTTYLFCTYRQLPLQYQ